MTEQKRRVAPLHILAANLLGTLLLGLGVAEAAINTELVPQSLRFTHYSWVMVACGVVLMLPNLLWTLQHARN